MSTSQFTNDLLAADPCDGVGLVGGPPSEAPWAQVLDQAFARPLRRDYASLALLRLRGDAESVDRAIEQIDGTLGALGRVIELLAAFASPRPPLPDRLALWDLLQEAWMGLEAGPVSGRPGISLHGASELATQVQVYGDRRQLVCALREALLAAAQVGPPGRSMQVIHRQSGTCAQIVLCRCGAMPGTGDRDGPGLGLQLSAALLARHGGRISEERDDDAIHWILELPTGAPHGPHEARLADRQRRLFDRERLALQARARLRSAGRAVTAES